MNKLILFLMLFVLISTASAIEYKSGDVVTLYTIDKCQGPIKIKVTSESGIKDNEMQIEKCQYQTNNIWNCECKSGSFNIKLLTPSTTKNVYDFTIQYYTQYKKIDDMLNKSDLLQELEHDKYVQTKKLLNVIIQPGQPLKKIFEIDVQTKNAVLFAILLFLFIIGIIIFKGKQMFSGNGKSNSNDVLSYKVTKDEDFNNDTNEVFNHIK